MNAPGPIPDELDVAAVEARLAELERQSDARRAELNALAAQLPAAISRRQLVRQAAGELRTAPNRAEIAGRAARKAARAPLALTRRALRAVRARRR